MKEIDKDLRSIPAKYYLGTEKFAGQAIVHKQSLKNKFRANLIRQQMSQAKRQMTTGSRNQLEAVRTTYSLNGDPHFYLRNTV